jgi:hypothetical protein
MGPLLQLSSGSSAKDWIGTLSGHHSKVYQSHLGRIFLCIVHELSIVPEASVHLLLADDNGGAPGSPTSCTSVSTAIDTTCKATLTSSIRHDLILWSNALGLAVIWKCVRQITVNVFRNKTPTVQSILVRRGWVGGGTVRRNLGHYREIRDARRTAQQN